MLRVVQAMHTTTGASVRKSAEGKGISSNKNKAKANSISEMKKALQGKGIKKK